MRLIDADVLLEHILKLECHAENKKYEQGLNDRLQFYFPQIIDKQPTAYDVEKVVAELEEELKNAQMEYTLGKYNLDNGIGENYRQDMNEGKCFAYDSAINIVRKGGVE